MDAIEEADDASRKDDKSIYDLISGDVYDGLCKTFLASGKGRRPDPPEVPLNNLFLLMLHSMRLEGNKTAKDMVTWFSKLAPDNKFPLDRLSRKIERTVTCALSLLGTKELVNFVHKPLNLNFISLALEDIGLDRTNIFCVDSWQQDAIIVSNEVVLDIEHFRKKEKLSSKFPCQWIFRLTGLQLQQCDEQLFLNCRKQIEKITATKSALQKNKARDNGSIKLDHFLKERFFPRPLATASASCVEPSDPPVPSSCFNLNSNSCHVESLSSFRKENRKLREEKARLEEGIKLLQTKLEAAHEEIQELNCLNANVQQSFKKINVELSALKQKNADANALKIKLKSVKLSLKRSAKQSAFWRKKVLKEQKEKSYCKDKLKYCKNKLKVAEANLQGHKLSDSFSFDEIQLKAGGKNAYSDNVRQTAIALQCDAGVAAANVKKVIKIVSSGIFNYVINESLPSKQTALNMCDEGRVLSNIQVAENVLESSNVTLHSDGTSRDNKKIVGHQITTDKGETFFLGFAPVACEDSSTLLNVTLKLMNYLAQSYADLSSDTTEDISKSILRKVTSTMTDRAASMKLFGTRFSEFLKTDFGIDTTVHFLHCNAHFLLGLSGACEKALVEAEKVWHESSGVLLGRDKHPQFSAFSRDDSATSRLIRTACDVLGPHGDQKHGRREDWVTFCEDSCIPSFKENRFNCFFEAAAAVIFHADSIRKFFSSGILPSIINLKLMSVNYDVHDDVLLSFVACVALFYLKVTGPYWKLLNSKILYTDFHKYVQSLASYLDKWSEDPDDLFDISFLSAFGPEFAIEHRSFSSINLFISENDTSLVRDILKSICVEASKVTHRQLSDFIHGPYSNEPDENTEAILCHCPLTNLVGESAFGDYDYDVSKRRNCSLHNRSAIHIVKRNGTMKFLQTKTAEHRNRLFKIARRRGPLLRNESRKVEEGVRNEIRQKFSDNQQKEINRRIAEISRNGEIVRSLDKHGGPCKSAHEVDVLVTNLKIQNKNSGQVKEVLKNEIRYINLISKKRILKFGFVNEMVDSLKNYFNASVSVTEPPSKKRKC